MGGKKPRRMRWKPVNLAAVFDVPVTDDTDETGCFHKAAVHQERESARPRGRASASRRDASIAAGTRSAWSRSHRPPLRQAVQPDCSPGSTPRHLYSEHPHHNHRRYGAEQRTGRVIKCAQPPRRSPSPATRVHQQDHGLHHQKHESELLQRNSAATRSQRTTIDTTDERSIDLAVPATGRTYSSIVSNGRLAAVGIETQQSELVVDGSTIGGRTSGSDCLPPMASVSRGVQDEPAAFRDERRAYKENNENVHAVKIDSSVDALRVVNESGADCNESLVCDGQPDLREGCQPYDAGGGNDGLESVEGSPAAPTEIATAYCVPDDISSCTVTAFCERCEQAPCDRVAEFGPENHRLAWSDCCCNPLEKRLEAPTISSGPYHCSALSYAPCCSRYYYYHDRGDNDDSAELAEESSVVSSLDAAREDPTALTGAYLNGLWIPSAEIERMVQRGELVTAPLAVVGPLIVAPGSADVGAYYCCHYYYCYQQQQQQQQQLYGSAINDFNGVAELGEPGSDVSCDAGSSAAPASSSASDSLADSDTSSDALSTCPSRRSTSVSHVANCPPISPKPFDAPIHEKDSSHSSVNHQSSTKDSSIHREASSSNSADNSGNASILGEEGRPRVRAAASALIVYAPPSPPPASPTRWPAARLTLSSALLTVEPYAIAGVSPAEVRWPLLGVPFSGSQRSRLRRLAPPPPPSSSLQQHGRRLRRRRFLDDDYVNLESDNCDIIVKVTPKNYRFILSLDEACVNDANDGDDANDDDDGHDHNDDHHHELSSRRAVPGVKGCRRTGRKVEPTVTDDAASADSLEVRRRSTRTGVSVDSPRLECAAATAGGRAGRSADCRLACDVHSAVDVVVTGETPLRTATRENAARLEACQPDAWHTKDALPATHSTAAAATSCGLTAPSSARPPVTALDDRRCSSSVQRPQDEELHLSSVTRVVDAAREGGVHCADAVRKVNSLDAEPTAARIRQPASEGSGSRTNSAEVDAINTDIATVAVRNNKDSARAGRAPSHGERAERCPIKEGDTDLLRQAECSPQTGVQSQPPSAEGSSDEHKQVHAVDLRGTTSAEQMDELAERTPICAVSGALGEVCAAQEEAEQQRVAAVGATLSLDSSQPEQLDTQHRHADRLARQIVCDALASAGVSAPAAGDIEITRDTAVDSADAGHAPDNEDGIARQRRRLPGPPPIVIEHSINANPPSDATEETDDGVRPKRSAVVRFAEHAAAEIFRSAFGPIEAGQLPGCQPESAAALISTRRDGAPRTSQTESSAATPDTDRHCHDEGSDSSHSTQPTAGSRLASVRKALQHGVQESSHFLGKGAASPSRGEAFWKAPTAAAFFTAAAGLIQSLPLMRFIASQTPTELKDPSQQLPIEVAELPDATSHSTKKSPSPAKDQRVLEATPQVPLSAIHAAILSESPVHAEHLGCFPESDNFQSSCPTSLTSVRFSSSSNNAATDIGTRKPTLAQRCSRVVTFGQDLLITCESDDMRKILDGNSSVFKSRHSDCTDCPAANSGSPLEFECTLATHRRTNARAEKTLKHTESATPSDPSVVTVHVAQQSFATQRDTDLPDASLADVRSRLPADPSAPGDDYDVRPWIGLRRKAESASRCCSSVKSRACSPPPVVSPSSTTRPAANATVSGAKDTQQSCSTRATDYVPHTLAGGYRCTHQWHCRGCRPIRSRWSAAPTVRYCIRRCGHHRPPARAACDFTVIRPGHIAGA